MTIPRNYRPPLAGVGKRIRLTWWQRAIAYRIHAYDIGAILFLIVVMITILFTPEHPLFSINCGIGQ